MQTGAVQVLELNKTLRGEIQKLHQLLQTFNMSEAEIKHKLRVIIKVESFGRNSAQNTSISSLTASSSKAQVTQQLEALLAPTTLHLQSSHTQQPEEDEYESEEEEVTPVLHARHDNSKSASVSDKPALQGRDLLRSLAKHTEWSLLHFGHGSNSSSTGFEASMEYQKPFQLPLAPLLQAESFCGPAMATMRLTQPPWAQQLQFHLPQPYIVPKLESMDSQIVYLL
jgi:hypothetical protein